MIWHSIKNFKMSGSLISKEHSLLPVKLIQICSTISGDKRTCQRAELHGFMIFAVACLRQFLASCGNADFNCRTMADSRASRRCELRAVRGRCGQTDKQNTKSPTQLMSRAEADPAWGPARSHRIAGLPTWWASRTGRMEGSVRPGLTAFFSERGVVAWLGDNFHGIQGVVAYEWYTFLCSPGGERK